MKKILLFILLLISFANASDYVEIKINKLHGLISFTESLVSTTYSLKSFKKTYNEKYQKDTQAQKKLSKYKTLYEKVKVSRIYNYKKTVNLYKMIKIESTFAKSLEELREMVFMHKTAIDKDKLREYFKLLKYFLPIYDELIWKKNYKKLISKAADIKELMIKSKYDLLIKRAARFYGLKSTQIETIYLSLYPIPSGNNTLAFMLGDVESIGVLTNKKKSNVMWLLSATVFHEIVHVFYDKQKKKIASYFKNYKRKSTKKVEKIFNESMATSIGAGWAFYKVSNGLVANGAWYNNKEYNRFAKIIYPTVSEYLDNNKTMDREFFSKIINLY